MANEIVRLYFGSQASPVNVADLYSGSYNIIHDSNMSGAVDYSVNAAALQTILEGISSIGPGNVQVTSESNGFTIEFIGSLANTNVGLLTRTSNSLKKLRYHANPWIETSVVDSGSSGGYATHNINFGGATSGTFDITDGVVTGTVNSLDVSGVQSAYDTLAPGEWSASDDGFGGVVVNANSVGPKPSVYVSSNSTDGFPDVGLSNGGNDPTPSVTHIWQQETGLQGSVILNLVNSTNTSSINLDLTDLAISSALFAALGASPSYNVTGTGTAIDPWVVTFYDPDQDKNVGSVTIDTPVHGDTDLEFVVVQEGSPVSTSGLPCTKSHLGNDISL